MIVWTIFALIACGLAVYIFGIRDYQDFRKVTSPSRGSRTERALVYKLLKYGIPYQTIFQDLSLKKYNGTYAQIDLVVATKVGLIVFEVKKYSGWIFGSGNQNQWTQVLNYGKIKHRIYNPILQNKNHIHQLKKKLSKENIPFFSVIVFYGDCELKNINYIPNGTYLVKSNKVFFVLRKILKDNKPATFTNKRELVSILNEAVMNGADYGIKM
ncbi:NERD domain-containing protein [Subsaximicrobium wynnwilliamsii]|uniref:NERD domain-containing protein n=1 Tax=Subsaximicrobium wynnwilliamsii TaxID=291179 RepID=A0A5C6ZGT0_9FLAO|nr:nuclease-related domain-containing protein [Subsaximicrobium wynnwilliamsii]TXD84091.1 NERD domain-containing protein [Subsaximicrobium wynnwilliamsii]TXD88951.1 NERD domain-containing protein [Subsaximicrobium wynnwilliamsii]TXE03803.1 NERD domain-containing protein [Subsaximicrobium wynnwilliamsii]